MYAHFLSQYLQPSHNAMYFLLITVYSTICVNFLQCILYWQPWIKCNLLLATEGLSAIVLFQIILLLSGTIKVYQVRMPLFNGINYVVDGLLNRSLNMTLGDIAYSYLFFGLATLMTRIRKFAEVQIIIFLFTTQITYSSILVKYMADRQSPL